MLIPFEREKYIEILRAEGINAAITALHRDTERWEIDTFEGTEGYQPQMWKELLGIREFSRELWEIALREGGKTQSA